MKIIVLSMIFKALLCEDERRIPFLKGVTYLYETTMKNRSGSVVLCKCWPLHINENNSWNHENKGLEFLMKEQCGDDKNGCSFQGRTECVELSGLRASSFFRTLAEYDERPVQLVDFALENGQTFGMYVIINDTVSTQLIQRGSFAPVLTALVHNIALAGCAAESGIPKLVLDVGCNLGLVSLIALSHGCDAVCVEPNGALIPVLSRSLLRNSFRGSAAVIHAAAAAVWQEVLLSGCGDTCTSGPGASAGGAHALAWGEVRAARRAPRAGPRPPGGVGKA